MAEERLRYSEPIAIVGIGCRLPGGANSPEQFWQLLREGRDAITEVPSERWDLDRHFDPDPQRPLTQHVRHGGFIDGIDQFDPGFFGISPREAVCMDPQQRLLLEVTWRALEDAGIPLERVRGTATGVFIGISSSDYSSLLWASEEDYAIPDNEPFLLPGNTGCIAANRLSYFFDLKGPSFTVDTACSSSLVAVHLACESIWRGESSSALAGGVQALIQPGIQTMFCKAGLLSPEGRCKSFDASANGYVRSEGAGVVLLKPLVSARADGDPIYALIRGTAMNSDGRSNGMVAPNLRAQIACVQSAFSRAGIHPAAAQYVEAHGTGTRQGDPIELRALGTVLGEGRPDQNPCRVGSVKTNLGHSETAAGITGLIKAALCVRYRQLPASLHFRTPNPSIDFKALKLQVQTQLEPFPQPDAPVVVGVSSFGFGGTNAHVVLAEVPASAQAGRYGPKLPLQLLTLSARNEAALREQARSLLERMQDDGRLVLADVCATANQCRTHFGRRLTALAVSREQLLDQLRAVAEDRPEDQWPLGLATRQASRTPGKLAFLCTGQGSQTLGMARALYEFHPVFQEVFDRCAAQLDPMLERPLASVLFSDNQQDAEFLNRTDFTQPALFVIGYALSQLWLSWGVQPDLLLGHSVGEVLAAHLAGVFSLEDALRLIAARGRLMQALAGDGGMLAVLASPADLQGLLRHHPQLAIAALNGPRNTVVSGPLVALERLEQAATEMSLQCQRLAVSHPFHSPAMESILPEFERVLADIRFSPPVVPLLSTLSGQLAGAEIAQPDYWCEQVVNPVRFGDAIQATQALSVCTFVELGASPTLIQMGRQLRPDPDLQWWPSLRPGLDDWHVLLTSLAGLHRQGYVIQWCEFHRPFPHRRVSLPGYAFQTKRYWWQPDGLNDAPGILWLEHIGKRGAAQPRLPVKRQLLLGQLMPLELPGGSECRYQIHLAAHQPADLGDHCIREQVVFPAAGFLLLALQACASKGAALALREFRLDQPLRLESAAVAMQIVIGERIEFHSEHAGSWRCHGQAQVDAAPETDPPRWCPPPSEAVALDLGEFYQALAAFGLNYGPAFRSLQHLHQHHDRAWAMLQRPAGAGDWSLLDGCFQAVAATLDPKAAAGQLFLPVGLDSLWLDQLPLPDAIGCSVHLLASDEPAFVRADLTLWSGERCIGQIDGFRLRRLPRQVLNWLFPDPAAALQPKQQPRLVKAGWMPIERAADASPMPNDLPEAVLVHWPDCQACQLDQAVAGLLALASKPQPRVWLVLEGEGPVQQAMAAMVRTLALEMPATLWFTVHLPHGAKAEQLPIPWSQIRALEEHELAVAFDGKWLYRRRLSPLPPRRFRMGSSNIGLLEHLRPESLQSQQLAAGELELAVEATGLNFRDVLNALGLLRSYSRELGWDEAAQMPFGGECVGRVVAVGPGVDPSLLGSQMVAALAVGSLASHVVCRAELCVPLPSSFSPEQGASFSTAFLTAIYGLRTLAQLQPGESVLIHAAAGGVGQAAVQVAVRAGARVFATASSAKQQLLREQGCEAVFDSRSLSFAAEIHKATNGRGVDVVLNSLKGAWVSAGFEALAQGGRFVELGKIEIWSRAEAAQRRPDVRYLPFDLLEVAAAEPALLRRLLEQLLVDLQKGIYAPLPLQVFELHQTVEAFRWMAQARHVGKVVIRQQPALAQPLQIRPDASYLVTGAFGGLGLQLVRWLVEQGATSLILLSRSAAEPSPEAQRLLEELGNRQVVLQRLAMDLAGDNEEGLTAALAALPQDRPLHGVFHAAGVLDDGLVSGQTSERLQAVLAPKWIGWLRLQHALQHQGITPEIVVQFSSMAALLGSPGQSTYAAANGALDGDMALLERPGWMSVQWGRWSGRGMAGGMEQRQQQRLDGLGVRSLEPEEALEELGELIARGASGAIGVLDLDWDRLARRLGPRSGAALQPLEGAQAESDSITPAYLEVLQSTPEAERPRVLQRLVQEQLAKVMGVSDPDQIDPGEPLFNLGLDSLMALELMVLLETNLGITLTESLVFEYPTVEALVRYFLEVLFATDQRGSALPSGQIKGEEGLVQPPSNEVWSSQVEQVVQLGPEELLRQLRGEA
jgi:myxalamid-type polyketide synthase MxaB